MTISSQNNQLEAYALFESAIGEFSPELIRILQTAGLRLEDDDESTVARFWDCLQRPAIEHVANTPIGELAREFAAVCLEELSRDDGED